MSPLSVTDKPSADSCSRMPAMRNADGPGADQDPQEVAILFRDGQLTLVSRSDAGQQLGQGRFNRSRAWGLLTGSWALAGLTGSQRPKGLREGQLREKNPLILAGLL